MKLNRLKKHSIMIIWRWGTLLVAVTVTRRLGFCKMAKQMREFKGDECNEQHGLLLGGHNGNIWPGSEFCKVSGRQPPKDVTYIDSFRCGELGYAYVHFRCEQVICLIWTKRTGSLRVSVVCIWKTEYTSQRSLFDTTHQMGTLSIKLMVWLYPCSST